MTLKPVDAGSPAPARPAGGLPVEDYAVIGDGHTAALVGRNGSIDWLCLPRFDSGACFAALLGNEEHGFWRIAPAGSAGRVGRHYRGETLVLETEFHTTEGVVRLADCMPRRSDHASVTRVVEGVSGRVRMRMDLVLRFDYGWVVPWMQRAGDHLHGLAGPDSVCLATPAQTRGRTSARSPSSPSARGRRFRSCCRGTRSFPRAAAAATPPRRSPCWFRLDRSASSRSDCSSEGLTTRGSQRSRSRRSRRSPRWCAHPWRALSRTPSALRLVLPAIRPPTAWSSARCLPRRRRAIRRAPRGARRKPGTWRFIPGVRPDFRWARPPPSRLRLVQALPRYEPAQARAARLERSRTSMVL